MNIVIIGTGNAAWVLGRKLRKAGHNILQVFGRDNKTASDLAYELNTESTNYWNVVNREADIYLVAVSDIAVEDVVRELRLKDETVVHTAASLPLDVLKEHASHYGVMYPVQSMRREGTRLPETPLLINASDRPTLTALDRLAHSISEQVVEADDDTRAKLHLAAVMVNNFANHLYALAAEYCTQERLDFGLLLPLIQETAARLHEIPPGQSQTGPAVRGDVATIEKHRRLLLNHPELAKLYDLFTASIQASAALPKNK